MKLPKPRRSHFEGLLLVETLDEEGDVERSFETEADVAKWQKPNCGACCHKPTSILVIGKVVDGKLNGKPLRRFVPGLVED